MGRRGIITRSQSIAWSPDSKQLAAYRVRPGYKREVHYVESSPADQLQPKHSTREYAKPGDALDIAQPVLFDVFTKKATAIDNAMFPNPYSLSRPVWRADSRGFTFEYNQRGHQVYRVIEVDASEWTGARGDHGDEPDVYRLSAVGRESSGIPGKKYRYDLDDGQEIIWMSERDGWSHLYLYDGATGR